MPSYCTIQDLYEKLPQASYSSLGWDSTSLTSVITKHSSYVDACFQSAGYVLPITSFSNDVRMHFVNYVVYQILGIAYYDKDFNISQTIRFDFDRASTYFEGIASGERKPLSIVDSSTSSTDKAGLSYTSRFSTDF